MNESIKKAIEALATKASGEAEPHKAMQFAQAALNLAHTTQVLAHTSQMLATPAK